MSCRALPEPDPDEPLLLDALRSRGLAAEVVAWDDPGVDWSTVGTAVVRSTWDYHHRVQDFLGWVDHAGAECDLWNRPQMMRTNVHKTYLRSLESRGVPVVPTVWFEIGETAHLERILHDRGWDRVVIKPAVSAGSFATVLAGHEELDEAQAHFDRVVRDRPMMVQPYVESVEEYGERSLVWIDGRVRHAVRKARRLMGDAEAVSQAPVPIAPDELELAAQAIEAAVAHCGLSTGCVDELLLYARVDTARDDAGRAMLMELELVEPSLFLEQAASSLHALADAIEKRFRSREEH